MAAIEMMDEEDFWKCRKHPSQPRYGVCPSCLFDRLSILCPDCANVRPCACSPSSSSFSSSSSSSSASTSDPARSSVSAGIGSVGRVSNLIESEPAFRRSRSVAFALAAPRSDRGRERAEQGRRWRNFWGLLKTKEKKEVEEEEDEKRSEMDKLSRSRSVGVANYSDSRIKGRKWQFPSPMRAFRTKKTTASKVVQQRTIAVA